MNGISIVFLIFAVATGIASCGIKTTPEETSFKRYPFESVHIKYAMSNDGSGTEDLYINDFGRYELIVSDYEIKVGGEPRRNNQTTLTREAMTYLITPGETTGRFFNFTFLDSLYKLKDNIPSYTELTEKTLDDGKFQLDGTEMVAGILTQRWKQLFGPITICTYKGLVLKRVLQNESGNIFTQSAILVDTLWKPDTNMFMVPQGIRFEHGHISKSMEEPPPPPGMKPPPPLPK